MEAIDLSKYGAVPVQQDVDLFKYGAVPVENIQNNQNNNFFSTKEQIDQANDATIQAMMINPTQVGIGAKEQFLTQLNALIGKKYSKSPIPSDQTSKQSRGFGEDIGSIPLPATATTLGALTGGLADLPILGGLIGAGSAGFATNPGSFEERTKSGLVSSALGALPFGNKIIKKLLSRVNNNIFKNAFKDIYPYQEAADKAVQEYTEASNAAEVPKPGLYSNPTTELQDIENQIGKYINAEAEHGTRSSKSITNRVEDIEDFWSDAYKQLESKIKNAKFEMPPPETSNLNIDMNEILSQLKKRADPRKIFKIIEQEKSDAENPFLKNLLSKAPTSEDSNAVDFMAKHRDFRDAMGGLKQDMKSDRYGSVEKQQIKEAINKGKETEKKINDTLTIGLGENKPEYDWVMNGYSKQIFPLRSNPVIQNAKIGKLSNNIIKDLRTNEPGMDVLRDVVKQDPELLRNVVGQRYIDNSSEIYSPNELTREYLEEMPDFKKLLDQRENLLRQTAKRKDISLQQKIEYENKLKEVSSAKSKARKKLTKAGAITAVGLGAPYITYKGSQILSND